MIRINYSAPLGDPEEPFLGSNAEQGDSQGRQRRQNDLGGSLRR